jgi:hypothetical protein
MVVVHVLADALANSWRDRIGGHGLKSKKVV